MDTESPGHWQYFCTHGKAATGWFTSTEDDKNCFDDKTVRASGNWMDIVGKW